MAFFLIDPSLVCFSSELSNSIFSFSISGLDGRSTGPDMPLDQYCGPQFSSFNLSLRFSRKLRELNHGKVCVREKDKRIERESWK
nr:hypothetical protein Iba_chr14aCG27240 [Ipomoea batatas]